MPKDVERSPIILPPRGESTGETGPAPAPRGSQKRRHRTGFFVSLALVALAVIVVLTGLFMHFGSSNPLTPGVQPTASPEQTGPFVTTPYDESQVNALSHLVDRMNYKELASAIAIDINIKRRVVHLLRKLKVSQKG